MTIGWGRGQMSTHKIGKEISCKAAALWKYVKRIILKLILDK
jgi:hypothetical protein